MDKKIEALLPKMSIFGGLDREFIENVVSHGKIISLKDGEFLYREDASPSNLYVILSGKIKFVHGFPETPFEILESVEGESVGGEAFIGILNYVFTTIAEGETTVLAISGEQIASFKKDGCEKLSMFVLNIARDFARDAHRLAHIMIDNFAK